MTDELTSGASAPASLPSGSNPTDLRSALEKAFEADVRGTEPPPAENDSAAAAEAAVEPSGERARDEHGRFARNEETPAGEVAEPSTTSPPATLKAAPPPGWSLAAKAEFDTLPLPVQEAIARREVEISNGFAKLAEYKGLDPFVDMARVAGKTLPEVVRTYVAAEQMLGQDFRSGIVQLCRMYDFDPAQLGQFLLGGQGINAPKTDTLPSGAGLKSLPSGADPRDAFAPVLDRLNSVDQRLAQWERQMHERESRSLQSELQRFAADPDHRYFENVRKAMGQIIAMNPQASLSEAYDQACWINPEIRPLLIKVQTEEEAAQSRRKADQARRASGSLRNGSPIPGAVSGDGPAPTLRAELERAFEAARI